MPLRAFTSFLRVKKNGEKVLEFPSVNALAGFYFISTVPLQKPRFYAASRASFCRYLSKFSDNSSFLCMFIIWTYFQSSFAFYYFLKYSIKSRLCHRLLLNFPCKFALPPNTLIEPPGTLTKPP